MENEQRESQSSNEEVFLPSEETISQPGTVYIIQDGDLEKTMGARNHATTRILSIVNTIHHYEGDVSMLKTRRSMLQDTYKAYDQAQSRLEQWSTDEFQNREDTEFKYVTGLAEIDKAIESNKAAQNSGHDLVRLPTVDLPLFSGQIEDWLEWSDKFNNLVHRRASLADVQKFEYLKLSLRGPALNIIDSLPTTSANYVVAYELLEERYNNTKLLIQKHMKDLFELEPTREESAKSLRNLFDKARKHLRSLRIMGQPVEAWNAVLIHLMANKLDNATRREWESTTSGTIPPTYDSLEAFITKRCQMLEVLPKKRHVVSETTTCYKKPRMELKVLTSNQEKRKNCLVCEEDHSLNRCNKFLSMGLDARIKTIKRHALCFNCLRSNHTADTCRSSGCLKCGRKNNTSIHREQRDFGNHRQIDPSSKYLSKSWETLLPTAVIRIMTEDRGVKPERTFIQIAGFGQQALPIKAKTDIYIAARHNVYMKKIAAYVTETITGPTPPRYIDIDGNDKIHQNLPSIQNTSLGWVVGGTLSKLAPMKSDNYDIEKVLLIKHHNWTEEELECEKLFKETTKRGSNGRFIVRLPLKENVKKLGSSKETALSQFLKLEVRFLRDPKLKLDYCAFMKEYLDMGHMEEITDRDIDPAKPTFYFPHHPVIRPESSTTKLRTVFNGSAVTSSGMSLNDTLMIGPNIQQELFCILIRFRCPKFVLTADIKKMFRQVEIDKADRQLQLIHWRFSPDEPVKTFSLKTVTYGTSSASFTAVRCLQQLAEENRESHPEASRVIMEDVYMDDLLTGHNELDKLKQLQRQLMHILSTAGFELHKWGSNEKSLLPGQNVIPVTKILGLLWDSHADKFSFSNQVIDNLTATKRQVLSEIQKVFDPLGLLSPIIINGKLLMQELWESKLDWDQPLPKELEDKWNWFKKQIYEINHISIPRHVPSAGVLVELHGFSDAAKPGYGAAIYVRVDNGNNILSHLLCAKSRVSPAKSKQTNQDDTIPRKELRAASLLADLMHKIKQTILFPIQGIYYWTDSMVTLDWINKPAHAWPTFIANRVTSIQEKTTITCWHHVRSKDNPADLISRGVSSKKLASSALWWSGPEFLKGTGESWLPMPRTLLVDITAPSAKAEPSSETFLLERFSTYTKTLRITAYCLRFVYNTKKQNIVKRVGTLALQELREAEILLIQFSQERAFKLERELLLNNKAIPRSSPLLTLNPVIDRDGIIRVGGRIQAARVTFDQKHPIILPAKCVLSKQIAKLYHLKNLHIGPQGLLYSLRMKYWPIHGKNLARQVVHQCLTCFKNKPIGITQVMGQLPAARINEARTFKTCGVDFGGPFTIKENLIRTKKFLKVYVALFICFSTRAVHLELVSSLTSAAFIAALRRFFGQRGRSSVIYCDNATNFTGASHEIARNAKELEYQLAPEISMFCSTEGVEFKFIPPRSPNFGGIWEAGIKSVKHHIKRVLGSSIPTYEEMLTLLKQIEGVLNSRPISPMSADPSDPNPLTPGHFLIGEPISNLPEIDLSSAKPHQLTRFGEVQKSLQLFWKRWRTEYLNNLQQRTKRGAKSKTNLKQGDLCLIKEDNLPPLEWITGRVVQVYPGPDGNVRVATLRTAKGEVKRAISKLCPFPTNEL
ncbi:uncharacterized protein LOC129753684 [Uranotaenia lowii]|uniref:uncharacterized protein LOC129753684 n=1 Tax=Uranotaenia lowii TaxID=190385 RepID=UPI002478DF62|nr:uncharacterized protein LOC129753684 [Uranotaenia lowii]